MNSHRMVGALIVCCILVCYIVLESRLFFLSLCPVGTLAAPWFWCVDSTTPGATQASPPHSSPPPLSRVGFSCSRLGSPTRLTPLLLLGVTFFLFLFLFRLHFDCGFLSWDQFTGPGLGPETAHWTAFLLQQGHQNQPYPLPKTTRQARP